MCVSRSFMFFGRGGHYALFLLKGMGRTFRFDLASPIWPIRSGQFNLADSICQSDLAGVIWPV
ncbi:hypothetical protein [Desulfovibrio sp.]|uniref:hypothetical protein n=1 Tax=Desulfovibrio sp. TaxID=885 RepID=UPI003D0F7527